MRPLTGPSLSRQIGLLQLKGRSLSTPANALVAEIRLAFAKRRKLAA